MFYLLMTQIERLFFSVPDNNWDFQHKLKVPLNQPARFPRGLSKCNFRILILIYLNPLYELLYP